MEGIARDLGRQVATNKDVCEKLLPELIAGAGQQLWAFGIGLAEGSENPIQTWNELASRFAFTSVDKRNPQILGAFLNGLNARNPELSNAILDGAVADNTLAEWYPLLQGAVGIDELAVKRLIRSLELGKAPVHRYSCLGGGGLSHRIPGRKFNNLLLLIAKSVEGFNVAIGILCMRISFARDQSSPSELIDVGCRVDATA